MADIFLSYAREDQDRAGAVARAFADSGWSVFWDPRIVPGSSWDEIIERELHACKCVVVLWTAASIRSRWVKTEARFGLERNLLVPATLDRCDPPLEFRFLESAQLDRWTGALQDREFMDLCEGIQLRIGSGTSERGAQASVGGAAETTFPTSGDPALSAGREARSSTISANDDFAPELAPSRRWYSPLVEHRAPLGALAALVLAAGASVLWSRSAPMPRAAPPAVTVAPPPLSPVDEAPVDTPDFGTVLLNDDFRDNRNRWPVSSGAHRRFNVSGGRYVMSSATADGYTSSLPIDISEKSDFQIRCRVTRRSGVSNFFFGLIWGKRNEENYFDFAITGQGNVGIARKRDGQFFDYIDPTLINSHVGRGDSTNLLVLRKEGPQIRFYVNGYQVYDMSAEAFFGNGVGFMIDNNLEIDFDDLVVTTSERR